MNPDNEVVPVRPDDAERAAAVIARAFDADPLTAHLLPDGAERAVKAPPMFAAPIRYDCLFGQVDRLVGYQAVACWLGPDHGEETPERLSAAGLDRLHEQVGRPPLERLAAFYGVVEEAHHHAVSEPHWYLRLLGVEPAQQGHGHGSTLLRHGLARADAGGHACFLETFREQNVPFYLHHGFEIVFDDVEPKSGIRYWGFLRRPNA